jgi:hypothetical protein
MKTNDFISSLRAAPDSPLIFVDLAGRTVHRGYHLTELKAASFETVDCGGQLNRWEETIFQLWVPSDPDSEYMQVGKFLKIFDRVQERIRLTKNAEVRIEYGDDNFFPSMYHVQSITYDPDTTRVLLEPPATTCKARDRRISANNLIGEQSCCGPVTESCCTG